MTEPHLPPWLTPPSPEDLKLAQLRHCWILDDEHGQLPGLLVEWRRAGDGWEGRVIVPAYDEVDERWRPTEVWLPASRLKSG